MTHLLAVTLGNTSVAMATATDDDALADVQREPLERLEALLADRAAAPEPPPPPIVVASVNPAALQRLRAVTPTDGPGAPKVARRDFPIPIATDVAEPDRVGVDRLLAALAAYRRTGAACVVVDCGTAVTVDAVDQGGTFRGGAILPGFDLMARALADGTARLPRVTRRRTPDSVIGRNTEEAILAGIVHGTAGAISSLVAGAMMEIGLHARLLVTGAGAILPDSPVLRQKADVAPNLVLEGLVLAYRQWQAR